MPGTAKRLAEKVQEAMVTACEAAGLIVSDRDNDLDTAEGLRYVAVAASRPGWEHEEPMLELEAGVNFDETVDDIRICCGATEHPVNEEYTALRVVDAYVKVDDLPAAVRMVLRDRNTILARIRGQERPPFRDLTWTWKAAMHAPIMKIDGLDP